MAIAILIPTYNAASFIRETLQAVKSACPDLYDISSVYILDDCSTDKTIDIARKSWNCSVPLKVIKHDVNLGECKNTNYGFRTLNDDGIEWSCLLHQDDIVKPNWLQVLTRRIKGLNPETAIICSPNDWLRDDIILESYQYKACVGERLHLGNIQSIQHLKYEWFWNISGSCIRVKDFIDIGGLPETLAYAADVDFLVRYFEQGKSILELQEALIIRREHPKSVSKTMIQTGRNIEGWLYIMRKYKKYATRSDRVFEHILMLRKLFVQTLDAAKRSDYRFAMLSLKLFFNVLSEIPFYLKR